MPLRLSGVSVFTLFQRSIGQRNQEMAKLNEQIASGFLINRPSDDPVALRQTLSYKDSLKHIEQYRKNITTAKTWLSTSETALMQARDLIQRAQELAIAGANPQSSDARAATADEIHQLALQLQVLANTNINGEYVFSGYNSGTQPFTLDPLFPNANPAATYNGDTNQKALQINEASQLVIQSRGDQVFGVDGDPATVDLFQTLADLEVALRANNVDPTDPNSVQAQLQPLKDGLSQILREVTTIGSKMNRLEVTLTQFDDYEIALKGFVSELEEINPFETLAKFQRASIAMQSTIGAASNILNLPSLMDFIQ